MATRFSLLAIFLFVLFSASGCSSIYSATGSGATIMSATAADTPSDAAPATIWTIDGSRVSGRSKHRLRAGLHAVSVVPRQASRRATLEYGKTAKSRGIRIAEMTINLAAGSKVRLAAVVRRHRTLTGTGDSLEPLEEWQTTVLPYVVNDAYTAKVSGLIANISAP